MLPFFNLFLICTNIIINKIDLLDYMWIFSVITAFYQSSVGIIKSISKYRYMNKFIKSIDRIIEKVKKLMIKFVLFVWNHY